ncbi:MAG: hypothetical protein ACD_2C00239G0006 [uncultured bacterium (gcode 4)]|uniref:Uncharacterized protein n=1 Tax=uncultured bacterium (gcode 4) TaxID=1234023 RepID=K2GFH8_9BACT|nr:MAG: hypothetical protein ACD_2C00239G0006 [uncultured bacterium (gcode 4)]
MTDVAELELIKEAIGKCEAKIKNAEEGLGSLDVEIKICIVAAMISFLLGALLTKFLFAITVIAAGNAVCKFLFFRKAFKEIIVKESLFIERYNKLKAELEPQEQIPEENAE